MRVTIIAKASNLRSSIASYAQLVAQVKDKSQSLAVNTLYHAAKHGDPSLLNDFYRLLTKGDQASFKRWVVKEISKVYGPDVKLSELFLQMKKDQWVVAQDTVAHRNEFVAQVEEVLANDDEAEQYGKFFLLDPDKEKNPFDTAALIRVIEGAVKRAEKEGSTVEPTVTLALKEMAAAFSAKAVQLVGKEVATGTAH